MMRKIVKQGIYAFVTPITALVAGVIIQLLFPRLLSPFEFGVFTTLISFTMLFTGISDLGVPNSLLKIVNESLSSNDGHGGFYIRYLLKWKLAALVILSSVLLIFSSQLAQLFLHTTELTYVIQATAVLIILFSTIEFVGNLFISIGHFEYNSLIYTVLNGSKVIFPILLILAFGPSLLAITVGVLSSFFIAALVSLFLLQKFKVDVSYTPPRSMHVVNTFLFYSTVLAWATFLSSNVDSIMLNYFRGPGELAFFAVSNSVVSLLSTFFPFTSTFLLSFLVQMEARSEKGLQRKFFESSLKYSLLVSIPLSFLIYLTASRIILFLWPPSYMPAIIPLRILSVSLPFLYMSGVCANLLMSKGKIRELAINTFIVYVFTWIMGFYLVSNYGVNGTALTFAISNILFGVVLLIFSLRMMHITLNYMHVVKPLLASVVIAFLILFLNQMVRNTIVLFIIAAAIFCLIYVPLLDADDKKLINTILSFAKLGPLFQ